jgi:FkbM family methyltransferase
MNYFSIDYTNPASVEPQFCRAVYFPDLDDHIPNTIRRLGTFYELDLLDHVRQTVPRDGVFLDVGANIGNHTVFLASFVSENVVSFEPHPEIYRTLCGVVEQNGLRNVTCVNKALGRRADVMRLGLPEGSENNQGSYTLCHESGSATNAVEVSVVPLDDLLPTLPSIASKPIRAIKIDVEGAEEQVLGGAGKTIRTHRPHLFIEIQDAERQKIIAADLAKLGYKLVGQFCPTPTYHFAPWTSLGLFRFRLKRKLRSVFGTRRT